ncbi:MAG: HEAT repeat domain-containing protein [Sandaracinaceae bacterium]|nr:HEAT repeat domain-containing protein [Sandaracinaceae bacterium]
MDSARRPLATLLLVALALPGLGFEWEGRLARLRRELSSPDASRRREVVEQLSSYPAAEVRDPLLGALEDEDPGVRAQAAEAVGRVRLREAVPLLLDWLDDPDADVRAAASRALGSIGEEQAVPRLVRVLGDRQAEVRRAGVAALAGIGGESVVVPLLGRLDDVDARVRADAATVLGHLGDTRAAVPLVGRARDDAPEVRTAVYSALGDLGDARAVPALVQGLRDDAPEPRLAAVAALGRLGSPDSVRPLVALLAPDADPRLARAVTAALGQIPDPRAREALVDAVAPATTREMAAQTLVEQARRYERRDRAEDAEAIVVALAAELAHANDSGHASRLADTLLEISSSHPIASAAPALLSALREGRGDPPNILRALGATGADVVLLPLLERMRSEQIVERLAVFEALRRYFQRSGPDGRAADPLLAALGVVTTVERVPVVQLLGQVRAARALPALRQLLDHPNADLRLAAIQAIGSIGDPIGASTLVALLEDRDARLRFEAARAVGRAASADVVTELVARVLDREPTDRHAIFLALARALPRLAEAGELPPATAEHALAVLVRVARGDDEPLAARALDAIAAWHPSEAAEPLARLAGRAGPRRARAAARALGAVDDDRAREALRALMDRPSVSLQTETASVLGEHGGPAEAALLLERGPSLPWPASAAAAFALARMARRGVLSLDAAHGPLCAMGASHDPFVRANVATAMAALAAPPCEGGVHPLDWLDRAHAAVVRGPAARWARAAVDAGHTSPAPVAEALLACAEEPLSPEVARVCARPTLPPLDSRADVFAYGPDQRSLLASRLVALRLADGSVFISYTDDNGHLRLEDVPTGRVTLEDPSATPLEP